MSCRRCCLAVLGLGMAVLLAVSVHADDSAFPNENDMFGSASATAVATPSPDPQITPGAQNQSSAEDQDAKELETSNPGENEFNNGKVVDNPLQIGGIFYQQLIMSPLQGQGLGDAPISMPLQMDTYLDARPNDRIRVYVDARLLYDPTRDQNSNPTSGTAQLAAPGSTTATTNDNPEVVWDQAWLKFDIDQTVFVTVGKQHVKWGASHTWNPTDFLTTVKYNPLLPYDTRLGNNMAKFELPWQATQTNFYAIALFDNPEPASTLQQVGGAFRAETVLFNAEVGIDAVTRAGAPPAYGLDISAPLGPLDVYGEAALLTGNTNEVETLNGVPNTSADLSSFITTHYFTSPVVQTSAGANYQFAWLPNRDATLGAEYFYNQLGNKNADIYPVLIFQGQYQPFYLGQHYASIYLTAQGPDSNADTSYTFSTISDISDGSFVSRLDFSWLLLSYLTFGAYADGHYGTPGGEFNFMLNTPAVSYGGYNIKAINYPATPFDLGLSVRLGF